MGFKGVYITRTCFPDGKQFGLTTADLQEMAELVGISVDEMASMYNIKWFKMSLTSKDIRETIENIDSEIEVGRFMMMIIPVRWNNILSEDCQNTQRNIKRNVSRGAQSS